MRPHKLLVTVLDASLQEKRPLDLVVGWPVPFHAKNLLVKVAVAVVVPDRRLATVAAAVAVAVALDLDLRLVVVRFQENQ